MDSKYVERSSGLARRAFDNKEVHRGDEDSLTEDMLTPRVEVTNPPNTLLSDNKLDLPDTGLSHFGHKHYNIPTTDIDNNNGDTHKNRNETELERVHDATTGAPRMMRLPLNAK